MAAIVVPQAIPTTESGRSRVRTSSAPTAATASRRAFSESAPPLETTWTLTPKRSAMVRSRSPRRCSPGGRRVIWTIPSRRAVSRSRETVDRETRRRSAIASMVKDCS
jgi:hypothetical protein